MAMASRTIIPADIITYRLGAKLVFVKLPDSYEQALDAAQNEFSDELSLISRDRISFHVNARVGDAKRAVRISEGAWATAVACLVRGEIVDIQVRPAVGDEKDAPPQYLAVPSTTETPRQSRSAPSSRKPSRQPSPSGSDKGGSRWFGSRSKPS